MSSLNQHLKSLVRIAHHQTVVVEIKTNLFNQGLVLLQLKRNKASRIDYLTLHGTEITAGLPFVYHNKKFFASTAVKQLLQVYFFLLLRLIVCSLLKGLTTERKHGRNLGLMRKARSIGRLA